MKKNNELISISQACEMLNINKKGFHRYKGDMKSVGGKYYLSDVLELKTIRENSPKMNSTKALMMKDPRPRANPQKQAHAQIAGRAPAQQDLKSEIIKMLKETTSSADVDNLIITRYVAELKRNARLSTECDNAPTTTLTGAGAEMLNPVFSALDQSEKRLLALEKVLGIGVNNRVKLKINDEKLDDEMSSFLSSL